MTSANDNFTIYLVSGNARRRDIISTIIRSLGVEPSSFDTGRQFLENYDDSRPGCLILVDDLPGIRAPELISALFRTDRDISTVVIGWQQDVPVAVRAMQLGAMDFLLYPFEEETLLRLIRKAMRLDKLRRKRRIVRRDIAHRLERLSQREQLVLKQVVAGKINQAIANRLDSSLRTVESLRQAMMRKMEVDSLSDLIRQVKANEQFERERIMITHFCNRPLLDASDSFV